MSGRRSTGDGARARGGGAAYVGVDGDGAVPKHPRKTASEHKKKCVSKAEPILELSVFRSFFSMRSRC